MTKPKPVEPAELEPLYKSSEESLLLNTIILMILSFVLGAMFTVYMQEVMG